jgi:hypothetical protein
LQKELKAEQGSTDANPKTQKQVEAQIQKQIDAVQKQIDQAQKTAASQTASAPGGKRAPPGGGRTSIPPCDRQVLPALRHRLPNFIPFMPRTV